MKGRKRKASVLETSEEWYESRRHSSLWKSTFLPEFWVPIWTIIRGWFHLSSPKTCSIYLTSVNIYNGLFSEEKSWQFEVGSVPVFRWTVDIVCLFSETVRSWGYVTSTNLLSWQIFYYLWAFFVFFFLFVLHSLWTHHTETSEWSIFNNSSNRTNITL